MSELSGNILTDNSMLSGAISAQQDNMGGNIIPGMVIGIPGKSAYEYALSAGYTGTETEFAEALAQIGQGSGNVDEETIRRIVDDYLAENPPSSGSAGATFYPSVDSDGNLSWTNDQDLPNPEPVNIMGPEGQGTAGKTAFEYAQDGGYTGTEEEFAEQLGNLSHMELLLQNANTTAETAQATAEAAQADFNANGAKLDANGKVLAEQATAKLKYISGTEYTLTEEDIGKCLVQAYDGTAALTITLPAGFPVGAEVEIMRYNTYGVTIAAGSGATIRAAGYGTNITSLDIANRYGVVALKRVYSTNWVVSGDYA